jgi:hypothetical protein
MYSLRTRGRFVSRTKYALDALLLTIKELRKVRWIDCICLAYCIAIPLTIAYDAFEPTPIEYARAEELQVEASSYNVATETPIIIEVRIDWTRERIDQEIEKKAAEYGKSAARLKRIVQCESGYDTDIQSHHQLSYGRERSFGLAQIHLPSHPTVSYEDAVDPEFAIDFLAKNVDKVTWYCDK